MTRDSVGAGRMTAWAGRTPVGDGDGGSPSHATVASAATATIATESQRVNAEAEIVRHNGRQILLMVSASFRGWVGAGVCSGSASESAPGRALPSPRRVFPWDGRTRAPRPPGSFSSCYSRTSPFMVSLSNHERAALRQACLELAERLARLTMNGLECLSSNTKRPSPGPWLHCVWRDSGDRVIWFQKLSNSCDFCTNTD